MTREEVRQAVVALVEARRAAWSSYTLVVEYDNRILVDTKTQTNPFLCVNIAYIARLKGNRQRTVYGQLHISAAVRENEGSAKANELLDFFVPSLHMRSSGNLRLWGSSPVKERPHLGWVYYPVIVPFEADTLV
jgi:hypothetical protein